MTAPRRIVGPHPPGRLPAAMLRALAAELSDPGRFTRAKVYARDGAVIDIVIEPGEVRAEIRGSRFEPYLARLSVVPADDADTPLGLVPERDEITAECTCPDDGPYGGGFCKHALAALLVLADEVTIEPELLTRWRSGPVPRDWPAPRPAARTAQIDVLASVITAPGPVPDPPQLPTRLPVAMGPGDDVLTAVLADALAVLRGR